MSDLLSAIDCAEQAIKIFASSFHPYALLGGIYLQTGNTAKSEEYFGIAVKNGADSDVITSQMGAALAKAHPERKRHIALYLLAKDRTKYSWAQTYL